MKTAIVLACFKMLTLNGVVDYCKVNLSSGDYCYKTDGNQGEEVACWYFDWLKLRSE